MSENLFNSSHKATNEEYRSGYERTFGNKPVIHEQCGGIAYYIALGVNHTLPYNSREFMRVDGTRPKSGEVFNEKCGSCGERIGGVEGQILVVDGCRYKFKEGGYGWWVRFHD